jgi:hypothetical protein
VLKVKHGGNPAFAFLLIDNPLQPYYQATLEHFKSNPEAASLASLLPPETASDKVESASSSGHRSDAESCKKDSSSTSGELLEKSHRGVSPVVQPPAVNVVSIAVKAELGAGESSAKLSQQTVSCSGNNGQKKNENHAPKHPPPEMMMTIEKLVEWIRKSGLEFEAKVKERQRGDPRFEFLHAWNPYNAYYRWRLQACLSEAAGKDEASRDGAEGANRTEKGGHSAKDEPAKAQDAGDEKESGAARGPDEEDYNPHAITIVQSITSFGGEDSSEEEDAVVDAASGEAQAQSGGEGAGGALVSVSETARGEGGKRRTRWEETKVATDEETNMANPGQQLEQEPAAPGRDGGLSDSERKAARLLRVKMLAQRLQAGTPDAALRAASAEQPSTAPPSTARPPANPGGRSRSRSGERKRSRSAERRGRGKSSKHKRKRSRDPSSERESRERPASRADRSKSRSRSRDRSRDRSRSHDRPRKSSKSGSKKHSSKHRKTSRKHKKGSRSRDRSESGDESHHAASRPRCDARAGSREPSAAAPGPTSLRAESPARVREAGPTASGFAAGEDGGDDDAAEELVAASAVATATLERLEVGEDLRDKVRAMLSRSAPP